jgi:autotransporter-associated beta strand protein
VNYTPLDVRAGVADPANRFTWYDGSGLGNVRSSTFVISGPVTAIPSASPVVMASNTTLDMAGVSLSLASLGDTAGNPTGAQVLLSNGTLMTGNDNTNTTFSGAFTGTGNLIKVGSGIFTLAGVSTHSGATTVSSGTLRLASGSGLGNTAISVASGAKLQPRPNTGATIATGATGTLSLGTGSIYDMAGDGKAGTFQVGGALTLGNNVTLNFDIGTNAGATVTDSLASLGAAAGSGTATINITGFGSSNLAFGRYNLLSATNGGLTSETFILGNSTVVVNGTTYGLSLIPGPATEQLRVALPANNASWIQTGSGAFSWGTAGNWAGGLIPGAAGDIATFGAANANNQTINLDQNRSLGVLTISNGGGGTYNIASNGFTLGFDGLGAGVLVTNSTGSNTISAPVNLNDGTLISAAVGTTLTFSGVVSSTGGQAVILGGGGTGTIALSNSNTFSGGLTIGGGIVQVPTVNNASTNGPLGNQTSVTLGAPGGNIGTLDYTGASSLASNMPFVAATGGGGLFKVDGSSTTLTLSGNLTGGGSFGTSGPGTVVVTGSGNTFSGGLNLNNGTLRAGNANSGVIGSGTVTFGASNTPTLDLNSNSPTTGLLSGAGTNGLVTNSAASGTVTLSLNGAGSASFAGSINKGATADIAVAVTGGGTQTLTGSSSFTGGISIPNGSLQIGNGASLAASNALTLGGGATSGTLILGNGSGAGNLTVSSLTIAGTGTANAVVGGAASVSKLTINNTSPAVYSGSLLGGSGANQNNVAIVAGGSSSITLTGNNTYSGGSTVNGGATLIAGPANYGVTPLGTGAVTLSGGTLALNGVSNGSGLLANLYFQPTGGLNPGTSDTTYNSLSTMAARFGGQTPDVSVATTTGGKANLDFSNNGYGGGPMFNSPGATTAAYGFSPNFDVQTTFTGYINIATTGSYTFSTTSDDGSVLFIDGGDGTGPNGLPAVNNNKYQPATKVTSAPLNLTAGLHAITIGYFQGFGGQGLLVEYNGADTGNVDTTITNSVLSLSNGAFVPSQSYVGGLAVAANSTVNITNSLAVSMGNSSLGAATLNVTSSDATASPYSLTLADTTLTGNATINVANSTGGGAGTVTLGPVSGSSSLTKQGPGTLVLSTSGTYSGGTIAAAGTVQGNMAGSLGTGPVTINNGATLRVVANPSNLINGFNGGTNWTVNSNGITAPPFPTPNTLTLTDDNGNEARSAFYNTKQPIVVGNQGFRASFTYLNDQGADGAAFVIQNDPRGAAALGGGGGALGYNGITNSAAYELNIYGPNTIGTTFKTDGTTGGYSSISPVLLDSGDSIHVQLNYDPVAQTVTEVDTDLLTGDTFMNVYPVGDLAAVVGGTTAFVGITGGDGGASSLQDVKDFSYGIGTTSNYGNNIVVAAAALATIDVTPTTANSTVTMGTLTIGAGGTLKKVNTGTLEVREAANLANNASILVNTGTLRFNNTSGAATIGTGVTATVASGATLELAGSVSNLSSPAAAADRVHIINNSQQAAGGSLLVSGTNQHVGAIDGTGDTVINDGGSLTANHIVQNALVIGGSAGNLATVTIAASDPSGNPLAASGGLALGGSLSSGAPFGAGVDPSSSFLAGGGASGDNLGSSLGGVGSGGAAVPEPSTLLLLALGSLAFLGASLRRRVRSKS